MTKPNNPYARPIDATKESAKTIGEYYGTRATDKAINHAAGGRNVAPASRYQAVGHSNTPSTATRPEPSKKVREKSATPAPTTEAAITAEDLFG
jgi:hypothetical protein